jgi:hypothetical protein
LARRGHLALLIALAPVDIRVCSAALQGGIQELSFLTSALFAELRNLLFSSCLSSPGFKT